MPRLNEAKYKTPDVQGEGSWIIFRSPSGLEALEIRKEIDEQRVALMRKMPEDELSPAQRRKFLVDQYAELKDQPIDVFTEILLAAASKFFLKWNWYLSEPGDFTPLDELSPMEILKQHSELEAEEIIAIVGDLISLTKKNEYNEKKEMRKSSKIG